MLHALAIEPLSYLLLIRFKGLKNTSPAGADLADEASGEQQACVVDEGQTLSIALFPGVFTNDVGYQQPVLGPHELTKFLNAFRVRHDLLYCYEVKLVAHIGKKRIISELRFPALPNLRMLNNAA